jgi:hypothetical protein
MLLPNLFILEISKLILLVLSRAKVGSLHGLFGLHNHVDPNSSVVDALIHLY